MSKAGLSPGDIILIEHRPPDDPSAAKARPAIVVSATDFNRNNIDIIVAPISSVIRYGNPTQVMIDHNVEDFHKTGLKTDSVVKCAAVFACPKRLIRTRLGRASQATLSEVRDVIVTALTGD